MQILFNYHCGFKCWLWQSIPGQYQHLALSQYQVPSLLAYIYQCLWGKDQQDPVMLNVEPNNFIIFLLQHSTACVNTCHVSALKSFITSHAETCRCQKEVIHCSLLWSQTTLKRIKYHHDHILFLHHDHILFLPNLIKATDSCSLISLKIICSLASARKVSF